MIRLKHLIAGLALLAPAALLADPACAGGVQNRESFQSVSVPLPPGQWEVVDTVTIPNTRFPNFPITQEILISRSGKVVDRVVRIWVQRKKRLEDWFDPYHPCDADGYFHSEVEANTGNELDCWHVRALSLGLADDPEPGNKLLAEFGRRNGLFVPVVMLGARFVRYHDASTRYYVEYLWTPDLLIPANTTAKVWTPADWTGDAVKQDAGKQAVVTAIVDLAKEWYDHIQ